MSDARFSPGATIGIVGGGQLGRMSAMAAAQLGYHVHILTPETESPAAEVAHDVTIGAYDDPDTLRAFAGKVDVVTFEFENVSAEGLALLEALRPVRPGRAILETSQDRITEKTRLRDLGVNTAPWHPVRNAEELNQAVSTLGTPLILKTTRLGYDGKGQFRIADPDTLARLDRTTLPYPLIAEGFVDFERELSVMVARGVSGETRCFDVTQNIHRDGILDLSLAPAPVTPEIARAAQALATTIADGLGLVGLLGVEMFVSGTGGLLVNEIAPRPHNSGHWTMDACPVDQFDMHVRAVVGLPLPPASRHSDAVMKNLIGPADMGLCDAILESPGLLLHLYGKAEARPGRKMGHVNIRFPYGALPGRSGIQMALGPLAREEDLEQA